MAKLDQVNKIDKPAKRDLPPAKQNKSTYAERCSTSGPLNDRQKKFCEEYIKDQNATQAYARAGYSAKSYSSAAVSACTLLNNDKIQAYLQSITTKYQSRVNITVDMIRDRWWELANVDVNELVEYRRDNCRYCWGEEFQYQFSPAEYHEATLKAQAKKLPPPPKANTWFVRNKSPNPECPECQGEGIGKVHVHDTRHLTGCARHLYSGIYEGKEGLKVLMRDRDRALENLAKHMGMFNPVFKHEISGELSHQVAEKIKELSDSDLEKMISQDLK